MNTRIYSHRLGPISKEQLQAALDRFHLGRLIQAEPIPFGLFGQNVFVSSTQGDYVLRGKPHFWWQFPTEHFYAQFLSERAHAPAPWPYLVDPSPEIFGWSYCLMPRLPGLQLADPQVRAQLSPQDQLAMARTLGQNLASMQEATWPHSGRYQASTGAVEPFDLAHELAWPFPVESDPGLSALPPTRISYSQRVKACVRHQLAKARTTNASATTQADLAWVETCIEAAEPTLDDEFAPCLVLEDYKQANLVVQQRGEVWQVSGVFDLMGAHFGDGEADLCRQYAAYLEEDPRLAQAFLQGYLRQRTPRLGFLVRFAVYMLLDRAIIWEFVHRNDPGWWDGERSFRDWASPYLSVAIDTEHLQ
jgi:aminoglycoside phosphotransferase (APT) family kinase protein